MSEKQLDGCVSLVTGASSGIGRVSALKLAENGSDVVLAARSEGRLEELADEIETEHGVSALVQPTDVTDDEQVARMVSNTIDEFGQLDIVLSNAGTGSGWQADVESISNEDYDILIGTNVNGTVYTAREVIPHLRESQGKLIFMGSFSGQYPRPYAPIYAGTKWFIRGFAYSVEGSVGEDGVAVTLINPGNVRTEFGSSEGETNRERFEENEALEPDDVANAVLFATQQDGVGTIHEIDLHERDALSHF